MFREVLKSKWFTALALTVVMLLLISIAESLPPVFTVIRETKNLNQKIREAKQTDSELKQLGDYLKSDAYLERQARLKLNYKKPDENAVFIYKNAYNQNPEEKTDGSVIDRMAQIVAGPFKNLQKWLGHLVKKMRLRV